MTGISDKLEHMTSPLVDIAQDVQELKDMMSSSKYYEVLSWVSDIREGIRYQELQEAHLERTGEWFLKDPAYIEWRDKKANSSLCLSGRSKLIP